MGQGEGGDAACGCDVLQPEAVAVDGAVVAELGRVGMVPGAGEELACTEEQAVLPEAAAAEGGFEDGVTDLGDGHNRAS